MITIKQKSRQMNHTKNLKRVIQDLESECNRARNGKCMSLNCLLRGGWVRGAKVDYNLSTCQKFEQAESVKLALESLDKTSPAS